MRPVARHLPLYPRPESNRHPGMGTDFESVAATITPRGYVLVAPPRFERGLPEPKSGVLTFAP